MKFDQCILYLLSLPITHRMARHGYVESGRNKAVTLAATIGIITTNPPDCTSPHVRQNVAHALRCSFSSTTNTHTNPYTRMHTHSNALITDLQLRL